MSDKANERKKVEEALWESEERYRRLADNSPDMIYRMSLPEGRYEYVSPASKHIFGYPPQAWYGNSLLIREILHPDYRSYFEKQWTNLLKGDLPPSYEYKIIHKDGRVRWVNQRNMLVKDEDNRPLAIEGIVTDITERKQAEDVLRKNENKLRMTLDATPFPIAVVDLKDDNIFYWSNSALTLFGHTAPTASEWYQIAYPDPVYRQEVIDRWKPFLEKARESSLPVNTGEYRVACRDGSERICELYATFLPDNLIVTFNDITVRKRAEEDLLQIFSMSLDMICIADINTATFMKVNPAFTEILGHSEEALLEKPFLDFVHPDDIDATQIVIKRELRAGAKVINFENRYRCRDGSYRWLSWVSHPNPEKGVTYAIARDITEWKQNEEALKKNKALLDATGRMARVGGWELNADTMEVIWTDETYRIHEVPLGQKPSLQKAIEFFNPEDRPKLELAIQSALEHGEPYDIEVRFITAKGKHLWTRTKCESEVVDGKVVKLKGTFQDVTDRKEAEDAFRKIEERLQLVIKGSNDAPWDWDLISNELYYSPQWWSQVGYSPDEVPADASLWERLMHPEDSNHVDSVFGVALQNGSDSYEVEFRLLHKEGHYVPVLSRGFITRDETGKPIRVTGTNMDLTERKRSEQQKDKLISDLQTAMQEVKQLSGLLPICSHCKKIRDDKGYWNTIESYIRDHSEAEFSHSICQECAKELYPDYDLYDDNETKQ